MPTSSPREEAADAATSPKPAAACSRSGQPALSPSLLALATVQAVEHARTHGRSGLITQTAISALHISETNLAKHTGHRSVAVLRRYSRHGSLFRTNPRAEAGL